LAYSLLASISFSLFFSYNSTSTTHIYTLSLHDALPICCSTRFAGHRLRACNAGWARHDRLLKRTLSKGYAYVQPGQRNPFQPERSEEHTSELQSRENLVCRLLLEKKKN